MKRRDSRQILCSIAMLLFPHGGAVHEARFLLHGSKTDLSSLSFQHRLSFTHLKQQTQDI